MERHSGAFAPDPNLDAGLALNDLAFKGIVSQGCDVNEENYVYLMRN